MKNVFIINTCDWGSTGKISLGLLKNLKDKGYNTFFAYGRGKKPSDDSCIKMTSFLSVGIHYLITKMICTDGYGSAFATKKLISKMNKLNIDTVYILDIHGHYLNEDLFFEYLSKARIRVVYLMIDEYAYIGACTYWHDCKGLYDECNKSCRLVNNPVARIIGAPHRRYLSKYRNYRNLKAPVFVGPEYTIRAAEKSPLMKGLNLEIVDEAIDTDFFAPRDVSDFRKDLKIIDDKIVLVCIAPYSYSRKGVKYYYDLAKSLEDDDRYVFVHVGYDGDRKEFPSNMIVFGYERDQEMMAKYYSLADLFVFPSLSDTMPNACLEALACGSPLLLFDTSGMPYMVDDTVAHLVPEGDVEKMKEVVLSVKPKTEEIREICRNYALRRYDNKLYYKRLESLGKG